MSHDHSHTPESFSRAFVIAIFLNLSFTLCQIFYAFLANSMSLMADATHNFGDVFGLVLAFGANWLLSRPARQRYSYGFKKNHNFSRFNQCAYFGGHQCHYCLSSDL